MRIVHASDEGSLSEAVTLLGEGRLVAFPTETVFGLGCDALSAEGVDRLYRVKGRSRSNPLIVHVASLEEAQGWGVFSARAERLARYFWAGALTLVVPYRGARAAPRGVVTAAGSVALRVPSHGVAELLLRRFGGAIAAPSANRSGCVSATCAEHVVSAFAGMEGPDVVLNSESSCAAGIESTVVSFMGDDAGVVLRLGAISVSKMEAVLGERLLRIEKGVEGTEGREGVSSSVLLSPGLQGRHYAPRLPLRLNALGRDGVGEGFLGFGNCCAGADANLSEAGDCVEAARNLYGHLHALDGGDFCRIAVAEVPMEGMGEVVNDRLRRAAITDGA